MRISDRIMVVARLRGITQAEIAEKLNISAAAVSAWAKEGRNPPSKHLSEIAGILGVSAEFLLTGKGGPSDLNLESINTDNNPEQLPSQSDNISRCLAIIESQQSTIATQSDTVASQHRLIEVMVVGDGKKAKRG